ncbi:MAG: Wzz/FepE/Etk N-terminal domain-containing protein [Clostridiaceae bacterium]
MDQERYIEQEDELDIKEILLTIKKHLVLVIILPIIFSGIAAAISFFLSKPLYQANVSIILNKDAGNTLTASDVSLYQSLMQTYIEIAKSDVVAERAVRDGNLKTSAEALQSSLTVSCKEGTQILYMSVISGQPEDAVKKVEALTEAFLQESKRLAPSGNTNIMDHAKVPQTSISSSIKRNIIIAFVVGLLAAIVLIFLLENMNDNVKSEEDVERNFDVPILGVIP